MKTKTKRAEGRAPTLSRRERPAAGPDVNLAAANVPITQSVRIKSILVPIDFSEYSKKALRYAVRFAEEFGSSITLLHVVERVIQPPEGYGALEVPAFDLGLLQKHAAAKLSSLAQEEIDELVPVKTLVRSGAGYNEIVTVAKEEGTDLIIIATHGRTGLKHLLLGSTAERVVRHAPCPVLTVREREHDFVK